VSTREAADLMAKHQIRRLPVVENDRLVGIVSLGDLAVREGGTSGWAKREEISRSRTDA
jgi:CBS-domain-containing membrane protein